MSDLELLFWELEHKSCDLRCRNVPTGGDDYTIQWFVIEHYMAKPCEREIGTGDTVFQALSDAFPHVLNPDSQKADSFEPYYSRD